MKPTLEATRSTPTMKSIAAELGVSRMTVSFALNGTGNISEEMRRRVTETAARLEYKANPDALRLKGQRPLAVGVFALWFDMGMGANKLRLVQNLLKERGYEAPLYGVGLSEIHDSRSQTEAVAALCREKPRVLVATMNSLQAGAVAELQRYQEEGGVLVTYDLPNSLACDQVVFDPEPDTYRAAKHLLELGHRKIGIGFHHRAVSGRTRLQGYQRALREAGIEARADWCLEGNERHEHEKGGTLLAQKFLALSERPSAMVILNDSSVFAFLGVLQSAGLQCPRDISVVGHDNHALCDYYSVPLTTVTHPVSGIAHAVVDFAVSRLDQSYDGPPRRAEVHGELIVRSSAQAFS